MIWYTSYYKQIENIPSDYIKVSISRSIPDYINNVVDIWDKRLSPSYCILKEYKSSSEGIQREKQYVKRFKDEVLSKIDFNTIIKSWGNKSNKYVLLCYEKPDSFCHRHIVAEAIEERYSINSIKVQEFGINYNTHELKDYRIQIKSDFDEDEW